jgi:predicted nucleotidyltransferase component of viral defense system
LNHRYSDDLDFFTRDRENLSAESHREQIERAIGRSELRIERSQRRGDHVQYFFSGDSYPEHPLEKVELVVDPPPYFSRPRNFEGVFVDDVVAIAVNKVTALSRSEPKDYVDLYEIVRSGRCRPEDLIPHAIEKDPGLDHVAIAADFRAVARLPNLMEFQRRYMVSLVDWDEVMRFYQGWADVLFAAFPPRRQE